MADAGLASATEGGSSTEVEENCSPAKSSGRASYARSKSHHVAGTEQLERQPSGVQLRHSEPVLGQQKQQQAVPTADQQGTDHPKLREVRTKVLKSKDAAATSAASAADEALAHKFAQAKEALDEEFLAFSREADLYVSTSKRIGATEEDESLAELSSRLSALARRCRAISTPAFRAFCLEATRTLEAERCNAEGRVGRSLVTRMLFSLTRCTRLLPDLTRPDNSAADGSPRPGSPNRPSRRVTEPGLVIMPKRAYDNVARAIGEGGESTSGSERSEPNTPPAVSKFNSDSWSVVADGEASFAGRSHSGGTAEGRDRDRRNSFCTASLSRPPSSHNAFAQEQPGLKPSAAASAQPAKSDRDRHHNNKGDNPFGAFVGSVVGAVGDWGKDSISFFKAREQDLVNILKEQEAALAAAANALRCSLPPIGHDEPGSPKRFDIMCRICEDMVDSDRIEEHSRACAFADRCDPGASASISTRLNELARGLGTLKIEEKGAHRALEEKRRVALRSAACAVADLSAAPRPSDVVACRVKFSKVKELMERFAEEMPPSESVRTFGRRMDQLAGDRLAELQVPFNSETGSEDSVGETSSLGAGTPREGASNSGGRRRESVLGLAGGGMGASPSSGHVGIEDFDVLKPISRGAFGRVLLARKRTTGDLFALKVLRKRDLLRKNLLQTALVEREALARSGANPFVIRLFYSFTSTQHLYLVMEYAPGGDLYSLLQTLGALEEPMVQTYAAEAVLALEYCHDRGIVHRDLKPDNLLISASGHLKLADFGLSLVGLADQANHELAPSDLSRAPSSPLSPLVSAAARSGSSPSISAAVAVAAGAGAGGARGGVSAGQQLAPSAGAAAASASAAQAAGSSAAAASSSSASSGAAAAASSSAAPSDSAALVTARRSSINGASATTAAAAAAASAHAAGASGTGNGDGVPRSPPTPVGGMLDVTNRNACVGTPDYLAPEILLGTGHGPEADWWALGVIIYELLTGVPPFNASTPQAIFENVLNRKFAWPAGESALSQPAMQIIDSLLASDLTKRLGHGGAGQVKAAAFFADMDWDLLARQKHEAAFVPVTECDTDTSYFSPRNTLRHVESLPREGCPRGLRGSAGGFGGLGNDEDAAKEEHVQLAVANSGGEPNVVLAQLDQFFAAFNFKNLAQLASFNLDLVMRTHQSGTPRSSSGNVRTGEDGASPRRRNGSSGSFRTGGRSSTPKHSDTGSAVSPTGQQQGFSGSQASSPTRAAPGGDHHQQQQQQRSPPHSPQLGGAAGQPPQLSALGAPPLGAAHNAASANSLLEADLILPQIRTNSASASGLPMSPLGDPDKTSNAEWFRVAASRRLSMTGKDGDQQAPPPRFGVQDSPSASAEAPREGEGEGEAAAAAASSSSSAAEASQQQQAGPDRPRAASADDAKARPASPPPAPAAAHTGASSAGSAGSDGGSSSRPGSGTWGLATPPRPQAGDSVPGLTPPSGRSSGRRSSTSSVSVSAMGGGGAPPTPGTATGVSLGSPSPHRSPPGSGTFSFQVPGGSDAGDATVEGSLSRGSSDTPIQVLRIQEAW